MMRKTVMSWLVGLCAVLAAACDLACGGEADAAAPVLAGTTLLQIQEDRSSRMVEGIRRFLDAATQDSPNERASFWKRDFSSGQAYATSVEPNRQRLRKMIGAVEPRTSPVRLELVATPDQAALVAENERLRVFVVRWTAWDGVEGEGLLLEPASPAVAKIVVLPDADQTPELIAGLAPGLERPRQFARRLAEAGCQVLVPVLIDRSNTWSGNPAVAMTDQSHREWVWRPAYELGRHPIGFEVQKVEAAIEWLESCDGKENQKRLPLGIAGYGEGGAIALYAAALDRRIDAALVSGYFTSRENLWSEPIYRSVFGLLREFGDAEIASLIAPRSLVIEHSAIPEAPGPPGVNAGRRKTAAPGRLATPAFESVRREVDRARQLVTPSSGAPLGRIELVTGVDRSTTGPMLDEALRRFAELLTPGSGFHEKVAKAPLRISHAVDASARQRRQVDQLIEHCQRLLRKSAAVRREYWKEAAPSAAGDWPQATRPYRERLWNDVIGHLPDPFVPARPRSRKIEENDRWTKWEVVLDVWPDVFAWGHLLVPKDLGKGERRPVVVCQHGLEGLPESTMNEDQSSRDWQAYKAFAHRLVERGFIVYCPHNPYRGQQQFRQLQRKANPLGLTLFSFIVGQHQRTLEWLGSLPFVDRERIGFYGLSYGGTSAVRLPALLPGYSCSICSAAFNDWASKVVSNEFPAAYVFTAEYDHFTWNLANTFNNAELAALIAPRPFMVERGHDDAVAPDEWVASEYAKVRRLYARLGIADWTKIEFFNGGHTINGQGTFDFLHRRLDWPEPPASK